MRLRTFAACALVCGWVACGSGLAQNALPRLEAKDGRWALMVDGAPYLMLGAQMHNSSAWAATLPAVWPTIAAMHANTLEAPISWEQWEPTPGHFDPSVLHLLLTQAREHHVHLVLLWFGTWKNGSGHYAPPYIKLDEARVPHVVGRDGKKVDSLSPYSDVGREADSKAFAALMRELKTSDPQHTVLMVQVENEIGTWGAVRDFSPAAQMLFAGQVPAQLLKALNRQPGTWTEVFGNAADESFYAWSIARYMQQVAAAGKAAYALPLYINVETRNPINGGPGSYASGGAVDTVIPIWKAMAPAIDAFGPDMYTEDFDVYMKLLDIYHRPDNAMLVPENSNSVAFARYFFAALGHGAVGWAPFGMDTTGYSNSPLGAGELDAKAIEPFASVYAIFAPMQRVIAKLNFEGKVQAVSENPAKATDSMTFGAWTAKVEYGMGQFGMESARKTGERVTPAGGAMVAELGRGKFLVTGVHARVTFVSNEPGKHMQIVRAEEGSYVDGVWKMTRIWNGDQTDYGLNFLAGPQVLQVTVATY